jgi:carbonic anhydrase
MSKSYIKLLENNRSWVKQQKELDPEYFSRLAKSQSPEYLWIGCSDSRVPADKITGTNPGEIFVHRNIANMVVHTDMNLLSVLSYAVDVLKVRHIIVCGHYNCGGINAAMSNNQYGLIDNWLRHIKDVYRIHQTELDAITDQIERSNRFVEVNVMEQVRDLCKTSIIQNSWKKGEYPYVHGWVYDVADGVLKDLKVSYNNNEALPEVYRLENA